MRLERDDQPAALSPQGIKLTTLNDKEVGFPSYVPKFRLALLLWYAERCNTSTRCCFGMRRERIRVPRLILPSTGAYISYLRHKNKQWSGITVANVSVAITAWSSITLGSDPMGTFRVVVPVPTKALVGRGGGAYKVFYFQRLMLTRAGGYPIYLHVLSFRAFLFRDVHRHGSVGFVEPNKYYKMSDFLVA